MTPQQNSTEKASIEATESDIKINESASEAWAQAADQLPAEINIQGKIYKSSDLSGRARKLLVIYLADIRLIGQQREMLALAELGLKSLEKEIIAAAENNLNIKFKNVDNIINYFFKSIVRICSISALNELTVSFKANISLFCCSTT